MLHCYRQREEEGKGDPEEHGHEDHEMMSLMDQKWADILSCKELSNARMRVLKRELNFSRTSITIPVKEMVEEVESGLRRIPQQEVDNIRIGVMGLLRKAKPPSSNITKEERQAIR